MASKAGNEVGRAAIADIDENNDDAGAEDDDEDDKVEADSGEPGRTGDAAGLCVSLVGASGPTPYAWRCAGAGLGASEAGRMTEYITVSKNAVELSSAALLDVVVAALSALSDEALTSCVWR